MALSARRQRFVNAYIGECAGNATQAAIKAGYSEKTARSAGSRLLTKADVRQALDGRHTALAHKADVTAERVLKELSLIAFSDIRGLFDEAGHLRPIHELPEDVARTLASVEHTKTRTHKHGDITESEYISKVKTWDKPKALEMLGRHLALWQNSSDGSRVTVNIGFLTPPTDERVPLTKSVTVVGRGTTVSMLPEPEPVDG